MRERERERERERMLQVKPMSDNGELKLSSYCAFQVIFIKEEDVLTLHPHVSSDVDSVGSDCSFLMYLMVLFFVNGSYVHDS